MVIYILYIMLSTFMGPLPVNNPDRRGGCIGKYSRPSTDFTYMGPRLDIIFFVQGENMLSVGLINVALQTNEKSANYSFCQYYIFCQYMYSP